MQYIITAFTHFKTVFKVNTSTEKQIITTC